MKKLTEMLLDDKIIKEDGTVDHINLLLYKKELIIG